MSLYFENSRFLQSEPLIGWINVLSSVMPPNGVVLVGAGNGTGSLMQWLQNTPFPATVVEGDQTQYQHLQRATVMRSGMQLLREVVAPSQKPVIFFQYSNSVENGLLPLDPLQQLWPQLIQAGQIVVDDAVTIDQLVAATLPGANWLIIDCNSASTLLAGAQNTLPQIDLLICRHASIESAPEAWPGLRLIAHVPGRHPEIRHSVWTRDIAFLLDKCERESAAKAEVERECDALSQEKIELQQKLNQAQRDVEAERLKSSIAVQTFCHLFSIEIQIDWSAPISLGMNSAKSEWVSLIDGALHFHADGDSPLYLVSTTDGNFSKPGSIRQLSVDANTDYIISGKIIVKTAVSPQVWVIQYDELERIASSNASLSSDGSFKIRFSTKENASSIAFGIRLAGSGYIDLAQTRLYFREDPSGGGVDLIEGKLQLLEKQQAGEIHNAVKQIESFVRLQHYLGSDLLAPEFHGWPISPDFAVLLIQLAEQYRYDGVIEFGSGSSTLVLAKALQKIALRSNRPPAPLLSFDHLAQYQQQTQQLLNQAGLQTNADVVLAPLEPWLDATGQPFSYYACTHALARFKQSLPTAEPKILVVVDGPPAGTGPLARYPAMPRVIDLIDNYSQLHFLMDDFVREDEQKIVKAWESELSALKNSCELIVYKKLEKQACLLQVRKASEIE